MATNARNIRKKFTGIVVSNKADKTVTIHITKKVRHPLYGKFVKKTTKIMAHDEKNQCNIGDRVSIMTTRPLSKNKIGRVITINQTKNG